MDFYIKGCMWLSRVAICASNFCTYAKGISVAYDSVDRDELGALQAIEEESAEVVSVGSDVAGSAPWANSIVSTKFSLNRGTSTMCPLREALYWPHP